MIISSVQVILNLSQLKCIHAYWAPKMLPVETYFIIAKMTWSSTAEVSWPSCTCSRKRSSFAGCPAIAALAYQEHLGYRGL